MEEHSNKKSGFSVPENYFSSLENRVMDSVNSSELKDLPPAKNSGFKVPESYFASFENRISNRVQKEEKSTGKTIPLFRKKAFYYIAASAAVLVTLVVMPFLSGPQALSIESINTLALENYIEESLNFEDSELLQPQEGEFMATSDDEKPNIQQQAIIEYLNENLEETAIIYNGN